MSVFVRSSKAAGAITLRLGGSYLRASDSAGKIKKKLGAAFSWIFPKRATYVAVTGRKRTLFLIRFVIISLECVIEITPDFLCPFMND